MELRRPGSPPEAVLALRSALDKGIAVLRAREVAAEAGFARESLDEIGLVVSELAANGQRIRANCETGEDSGEDSTPDPQKTLCLQGF